jgi:uncharacterized protein YecE (DUF72 family)
MTRKKGKIYIGTSGWHYKHWKETFYPKGVKEPQFLEYYLKFYNTVEINNSFYHLPLPHTFDQWRKSVPDHFLFAVKGSRYITHMKKLSDPLESLEPFIKNVSLLKEKLGIILFQLPPGWKYNETRFAEFTEALPAEFRYAFEFRNHSWYNESAYTILKSHNMAFCIYEIDHHLSPILSTADYVYVRLHGPEGKYAGSYTDAALRQWADRCKQWHIQGKDVFFYFDNDQLGYAAFNAIKLKEMISNN